MNHRQGMMDERIIIHADPDLCDIIPGFLERKQQEVKSMLEELCRGDYDAIRVQGHNWKGAGEGYGFEFITELGRCIETAASHANPEEIRTLVGRLSTYLEQVVVVYD